MAYFHRDGRGQWHPFSEEQNKVIENAWSVNAERVKLPKIISNPEGLRDFEVRFGNAAVSEKMPNPPETKMIQVNLVSNNTRVVKREEVQKSTGEAPPPAPKSLESVLIAGGVAALSWGGGAYTGHTSARVPVSVPVPKPAETVAAEDPLERRLTFCLTEIFGRLLFKEKTTKLMAFSDECSKTELCTLAAQMKSDVEAASSKVKKDAAELRTAYDQLKGLLSTVPVLLRMEPGAGLAGELSAMAESARACKAQAEAAFNACKRNRYKMQASKIVVCTVALMAALGRSPQVLYQALVQEAGKLVALAELREALEKQLKKSDAEQDRRRSLKSKLMGSKDAEKHREFVEGSVEVLLQTEKIVNYYELPAIVAPHTGVALDSGNYPLKDLVLTRDIFSCSELEQLIFMQRLSLWEMCLAGFEPLELVEAGLPVAKLEQFGFTLEALAVAAVPFDQLCKLHTIPELLGVGIPAVAFKETGLGSAKELVAAGIEGGYQALRGGGYDAAECKEAGASAAELLAAGFSAAELHHRGAYAVSEMLLAGVSTEDMRLAGIDCVELRKAGGLDAAALLSAGFGVSELLRAFSAPVEFSGWLCAI